MLRVLIVVLLTTALGPLARAEGLTTRDGRAVRNVAVVSRLGDTAVLFHAVMGVPIGAFEPERHPVVIPGFGIDARIERAAASLLAPGFNIVALQPGVADSASDTWERRTAGEKTRNLPPRDDIDAVLVVCRDDSLDEVGDTMLTIEGLGLYHRFKLFGYITAAFAVYRVMLIDARTGETITDRESGMETGIFEPSLPVKRLDDARWPADDATLSPEQVALLRDDLTALVDESLVWTLRKMKLAP